MYFWILLNMLLLVSVFLDTWYFYLTNYDFVHALRSTTVQNNQPLDIQDVYISWIWQIYLDARQYTAYWLMFKRQQSLCLLALVYLPRLTEPELFCLGIRIILLWKPRCLCKSYSVAWYSLKVTFQRARTSKLVKLGLSLILPVLIRSLSLLPDEEVKKWKKRHKDVFTELIPLQSSEEHKLSR